MDIAKIRKKAKDFSGAGERTEAPDPEASTGGIRTVQEPAAPPGGIEEGKAASEAPAETADIVVELLTFSLAKEEFAFRVRDIQEIIKDQRITRIPRSEPYLLGITSLRGKIIPVVDLKKRLSLDGGREEERKRKILILKGPRGPIGAVVDRVIGVIRQPLSRIGEAPPHLLETEMKFIEGVAVVDGRFISIIKTEEAMNIA